MFICLFKKTRKKTFPYLPNVSAAKWDGGGGMGGRGGWWGETFPYFSKRLHGVDLFYIGK